MYTELNIKIFKFIIHLHLLIFRYLHKLRKRKPQIEANPQDGCLITFIIIAVACLFILLTGGDGIDILEWFTGRKIKR